MLKVSIDFLTIHSSFLELDSVVKKWFRDIYDMDVEVDIVDDTYITVWAIKPEDETYLSLLDCSTELYRVIDHHQNDLLGGMFDAYPF